MADTREIFSDLLTIEVNTIVKPNITAQKMPQLPFALLDIIEAYAGALRRAGAPLERYFGPSRAVLEDRLIVLYARRKEVPAYAEYWAAALDAYRLCAGRTFSGEPPELWAYLPNLWPLLVGESTLADHTPQANYRFSMAAVTNGWESFERLRIASHELRDAGLVVPDDHEVVTRILGASARLKYIIQGIQRRFGPTAPHTSRTTAHWNELVPKTRQDLIRAALHAKRMPALLRNEDARSIRKIWEVGVETVLVQTSVQIDGNVVTRISEHLFHAHAEQIRALVLDTHQQSVNVGLSHWQALVQTTIELFGSLFDRLRRR